MNRDPFEHVLGTKTRAKRKELMDSLEQSFSNPIIHREIHGDKVYVPLDLNRVWDRIR
ncbi:hypothetical protein [Neobacillus muris]|uniref:hypothetical protein n=1 Tax=Neobacillus muris TaxID=2941334 RepID=UPI00203E3296|nr:hypothetical protein [Neobacillus muris]